LKKHLVSNKNQLIIENDEKGLKHNNYLKEKDKEEVNNCDNNSETNKFKLNISNKDNLISKHLKNNSKKSISNSNSIYCVNNIKPVKQNLFFKFDDDLLSPRNQTNNTNNTNTNNTSILNITKKEFNEKSQEKELLEKEYKSWKRSVEKSQNKAAPLIHSHKTNNNYINNNKNNKYFNVDFDFKDLENIDSIKDLQFTHVFLKEKIINQNLDEESIYSGLSKMKFTENSKSKSKEKSLSKIKSKIQFVKTTLNDLKYIFNKGSTSPKKLDLVNEKQKEAFTNLKECKDFPKELFMSPCNSQASKIVADKEFCQRYRDEQLKIQLKEFISPKLKSPDKVEPVEKDLEKSIKSFYGKVKLGKNFLNEISNIKEIKELRDFKVRGKNEKNFVKPTNQLDSEGIYINNIREDIVYKLKQSKRINSKKAGVMN
jgi:hypothetical protein